MAPYYEKTFDQFNVAPFMKLITKESVLQKLKSNDFNDQLDVFKTWDKAQNGNDNEISKHFADREYFWETALKFYQKVTVLVNESVDSHDTLYVNSIASQFIQWLLMGLPEVQDQLLTGWCSIEDNQLRTILLETMMEDYWTQKTERAEKPPMRDSQIQAIYLGFTADIPESRRQKMLSARASICLTYLPMFSEGVIEYLSCQARVSFKSASVVSEITRYAYLHNPNREKDEKTFAPIPLALDPYQHLQSDDEILRFDGLKSMVYICKIKLTTVAEKAKARKAVEAFKAQYKPTQKEKTILIEFNEYCTEQKSDYKPYSWFSSNNFCEVLKPEIPTQGEFIDCIVQPDLELRGRKFFTDELAVQGFLQKGIENYLKLMELEELAQHEAKEKYEKELLILLRRQEITRKDFLALSILIFQVFYYHYPLTYSQSFPLQFSDLKYRLSLDSPLSHIPEDIAVIYARAMLPVDEFLWDMSKGNAQFIIEVLNQYLEEKNWKNNLESYFSTGRQWLMSQIPTEYLEKYEGRVTTGYMDVSWRNDPIAQMYFDERFLAAENLTAEDWETYAYYLRTAQSPDALEKEHPFYQRSPVTPYPNYIFAAYQNKWIAKDEVLDYLIGSGDSGGFHYISAPRRIGSMEAPHSGAKVPSSSDLTQYDKFCSRFSFVQELSDLTLTSVCENLLLDDISPQRTGLLFIARERPPRRVCLYAGAKYLKKAIAKITGDDIIRKKGDTQAEDAYLDLIRSIKPHRDDTQGKFEQLFSQTDFCLKKWLALAFWHREWRPYIFSFISNDSLEDAFYCFLAHSQKGHFDEQELHKIMSFAGWAIEDLNSATREHPEWIKRVQDQVTQSEWDALEFAYTKNRMQTKKLSRSFSS